MNDQQTATASLPIAILHRTTTLSITFVQKPSDAARQQLKDAGYRFDNGKWYKSVMVGQHADAELIGQVLAA